MLLGRRTVALPATPRCTSKKKTAIHCGQSDEEGKPDQRRLFIAIPHLQDSGITPAVALNNPDGNGLAVAGSTATLSPGGLVHFAEPPSFLSITFPLVSDFQKIPTAVARGLVGLYRTDR